MNAYLRGRSPGQVSLEYTVLEVKGADTRPEEWTAVDSLAILKLFGWQLGANVDEELARALTVAAVGTDRADDLTPAHPLRGHDPIVRGGTVVGKAFDPDAPGSTTAAGGPGGAVRRCPPPATSPGRRTRSARRHVRRRRSPGCSAPARGSARTPGW